jgi:hypothetical protein
VTVQSSVFYYLIFLVVNFCHFYEK